MKNLLSLTIALALALAVTRGMAAPQPSVVALEWDQIPAADQVTQVHIYEKLSATERVLIGSAPGNATTLTLPALEPRSYTLFATCFNSRGESGESNTVILPALPTPPPGLRIKVVVQVEVQQTP